MSVIQQHLSQLIIGQDLTSAEMEAAMDSIMQGEATPAQIAGFVVALRMKGETVEEIAAAAAVMRDLASGVSVLRHLTTDAPTTPRIAAASPQHR